MEIAFKIKLSDFGTCNLNFPIYQYYLCHFSLQISIPGLPRRDSPKESFEPMEKPGAIHIKSFQDFLKAISLYFLLFTSYFVLITLYFLLFTFYFVLFTFYFLFHFCRLNYILIRIIQIFTCHSPNKNVV